jgi:hypothetical protein
MEILIEDKVPFVLRFTSFEDDYGHCGNIIETLLYIEYGAKLVRVR